MRVKGTGLGLFIVRSVVAHTAARCSPRATAPATAARSPCSCRRRRRRMSRILIVEDEQHLADGLRFNLEAEGYDVDVVDNGEEALARLIGEPDRPTIWSILDVMLPGIDGFAVVVGAAPGAAVRAGPDADGARPIGRRAARASTPAPTTTCRSRSSSPILMARVRGLLRRHEWLAPDARRRPVATRSLRRRRIDFEQLSAGRREADAADADGGGAAALSGRARRQGRCRARRSSKRSGACARTPTPARSTTSSSGCGATSRTSRQPKHLQTVRGVGYRFVAEPES